MGKLSVSRIIFVIFSAIVFSANILILFSQSIRLDESQSIWVSTKSIGTILKLTSQDVHVPLYGVLLHFWMQVFGTDIVVVRSLSLLLFILSIYFLYRLGKKVGGEGSAFLATFFYLLSPFVVWYSAETRMYTLFLLVVIINANFFLDLIRSDFKKGRVGYFLSTIFGFYTHYFYAFVVATQAIFVFVKEMEKIAYIKESEGKSFWEVFKERWGQVAVFPVLILGSLVFLGPWLGYFISQGAGASTQPLIASPTSYNLIQTFVNFLFGFQSQNIQSVLVSLWPLVLLLIFSIFTSKKPVGAGMQYVLTSAFLPIILAFLVSKFKSIYLPRYLIFVTPSLFLSLAWIFTSFSQKLYSLLAGSFLFLMLAFLISQDISGQTPVKENYTAVAQYLTENAKAQDIVAITPPFTVYPIEYSYEGTAKIVTIPQWDRFSQGAIPPFSQNSLVSQIDGYKKVYGKVFVVFSYDQGYEQGVRDYFDKNFQLLTYKNFSPGLYVRVYRLRYDINL